jgi:hypothetical protein
MVGQEQRPGGADWSNAIMLGWWFSGPGLFWNRSIDPFSIVLSGSAPWLLGMDK